MVVLLASTIISCSEAMSLVYRLTKVVGLSEVQRTEIIREIRKVVPSCPVKVVKNE